MDWGVISAVAEVVAAVAVVVSLIYLAVQVRGNCDLLERTIQATRTQNAQSVIENFDAWRRLIVETNRTDLWFRGAIELERRLLMADLRMSKMQLNIQNHPLERENHSLPTFGRPVKNLCLAKTISSLVFINSR